MLPLASKANWCLRAGVGSKLLLEPPPVAVLLLFDALGEGGELEVLSLLGILPEKACSIGILTVLLTELAAKVSPPLKIVLRQFEFRGEQFSMLFQ